MTARAIRRAALWLREQARLTGLREAEARLDRRSRWARAHRQPRDPQGRWTR
jgi:hypothetical protein